MMLQFTSSAEGVGHPWAPGKPRQQSKIFFHPHQLPTSLQPAVLAGQSLGVVRHVLTRLLHARTYPLHAPASPFCRVVIPSGEKRVNKVVFIGKNLNRQELTDGFMSCLEVN